MEEEHPVGQQGHHGNQLELQDHVTVVRGEEDNGDTAVGDFSAFYFLS